VICGDVNAHGSWDANHEEDILGNQLEEWALENNMVTMNSGEPTHQAGTAPDVSFVSPDMADDVDWQAFLNGT
jgi:hypothetical protein